jgi:MscS family membrane protein
VLDRRVLLDIDEISPLATGDTQDGQPKGVDQIAEIGLDDDSAPQPVRIARSRKKGASWVFTRDTVEHVDDWYVGLEDRWLLENLPAPLLRMGPRGVLWWQWIALPCVLVLAWMGGWGLARVTRRLAKKPLERTQSMLNEKALLRLSAPITLFWALVLSWFGIQYVHLLPRAEDFVERAILAGYLLALFWALFRLVDFALHFVTHGPWGRSHATGRALLPLVGRVAKVLLAAIAIVALLAQLGYPIASLLAGLGIGGLALALAAQKTVENLFGAFSIGADQPFREGDLVRIENFTATVEFIGLRSTRFRTADRSIITIPNGKLAEMRTESLAVRDRLRFVTIVNLVFDATEAQIRAVIAGCERVMTEHPKTSADSATARFIAIGTSSFDIEVSCYFETSDWNEFLTIRQDVLLSLRRVVEEAGTAFAYPTQTVQLHGAPRE